MLKYLLRQLIAMGSKRKPTPKYKQPLPQGLSKAQILGALVKRTKTAQAVSNRRATKKGSGRFELGVRTSRWRDIDKRKLYTTLTKSKFRENQIVGEKLARVLDDIERHFDIPSMDMETLDNILRSLLKAEKSKKQVSLTPHQTILLDKYFDMV